VTPFEFYIDLTPGKSAFSTIIHCSQDDVGRPYLAYLVYLGELFEAPEGAEAELQIRKPSGNIIEAAAVVEGNTVYFELEQQYTVEKGNCVAQIVICYDGNRIGSQNFILRVEPSPIDSGKESETALNWVQQTAANADRAEAAAALVKETDKTLSIEDRPADAGAAGDVIAAIKSGTEDNADYHLGFYKDNEGYVCQKG